MCLLHSLMMSNPAGGSVEWPVRNQTGPLHPCSQPSRGSPINNLVRGSILAGGASAWGARVLG